MTESKIDGGRAAPATSVWYPFRYPIFRWLWLSAVVSNIGTWMYNAAAGWLMTSLDPSPLMVSLVQVAASLPMFLFAMPAGAVADIVDRRRFILALEIGITFVAVAFAALVGAELTGPATLLLFMFLIATFGALEAPAWQAVVPQAVPKEHLDSAIAANSVGINISRAIGPALAGVLIAVFGIAAPFWLVAISNFGVIIVFWRWQSQKKPAHGLPAERVMGAVRTGFRHARNNRHLRATLARSAGFFLFASAYWALLPLIARDQIGSGPELYGILLGAIGLGAMVGAFTLPRLKARFGHNGLATMGQAGTAAALFLYALAEEPIVAISASLIAGLCWIAVVANLNVSAQIALPEWVRGRGLAMYVTVFFGSMTVGSGIWGELARTTGLTLALLVAAGGALLAAPLVARWKLRTAAGLDLNPSMHWPEPVVTGNVDDDAGPVMILVEYRIQAKDREAFLIAIEELASERKRDGAYAWDVFQDTADDTRFVESFFLESWIEHLRQHQRVTNADRRLEQHLAAFFREPPVISHLVATGTERRKPIS